MAVLGGIHPPSASAKHTLHHTCPAFSGDFEYLFVGTTTGDVAVVLIKNLVVQHFLLCLQGTRDEHGLDFPSDISLSRWRWQHRGPPVSAEKPVRMVFAIAAREHPNRGPIQFKKEYCVERRRHDLTRQCSHTLVRESLENLGRSRSAEKHMRVVLAMDRLKAATGHLLRGHDGQLSSAWN